MKLPWRMRFGIFMAPFHKIGENPTASLQRDLDLIAWLDHLDFDEAYVGEHHSGGWENITDPAVFIAAAAQQTRTIKLGTGVTSLPYHHPLNVADRMVLLDHLTRGRIILGVGPGALPSDAMMYGIDHSMLRPRMEESLGVIIRLLDGETVNHKSDWFELNDARLHVLPYSRPRLPIAVAGVQTPAGPTAAGKYGVGLIAIASTVFGGLGDYAGMWRTAEEAAAEAGQTISREDWRITMPLFIAESKKEAINDIKDWFLECERSYIEDIVGRPHKPGGGAIEPLIESGLAIVGTPDDAIKQIERLQEASGGFGGLLAIGYEWTTNEKIRHSYELLARYVAPHFQGTLEGPVLSGELVASKAAEANVRRQAATVKAFEDAGKAVTEEMRASLS
ncbi:MAG: LLM class flavin-dependent oxidoreductase [Dehalococcoidia bacterium]|nr:LLM class flavin-dependent oxidoreductase [Dehalococcoidia bacterium]